MPKKNLCEIVILLDRSASMQAIASDTIEGFNRFIEEQCQVPGEAVVTLYQFATLCRNTFVERAILAVGPLDYQTYDPNGWSTALHDAVCATIDEVGVRLQGKNEEDRPEKVLFAIITDGLENNSMQYKRKDSFDRIRHQEEKYGWKIVYLGQHADVWREAAGIGVESANTASFAKTRQGTRQLYGNLSSVTTEYRAD